MVRDLLKATAQYLRENPQEVVKTAVNAAGLKFGVPIAALSWLAAQVKGKKAPKDIELGTVPPALRLGATVDAMGTQLRAAASIKIDEIEITAESLPRRPPHHRREAQGPRRQRDAGRHARALRRARSVEAGQPGQVHPEASRRHRRRARRSHRPRSDEGAAVREQQAAPARALRSSRRSWGSAPSRRTGRTSTSRSRRRRETWASRSPRSATPTPEAPPSH